MSDHIADVGKMVPDEWTVPEDWFWAADRARNAALCDDENDQIGALNAAIAAVAPLIRAAERERCHEIAFHEHLAATHDDEDDGNTNLVARFKSQGAADGAARIMAAIRAMPEEGNK